MHRIGQKYTSAKLPSFFQGGVSGGYFRIWSGYFRPETTFKVSNLKTLNSKLKTLNYLLCLATLLLLSCKSPISSEAEFYKWLNDPAHGLIKKKTLGGLDITVKYLPPQYLEHRELSRMENYTRKDIDSIHAAYAYSRVFLVSLSTNAEFKNEDIMKIGIANKEEYEKRSMLLNFQMKEFISLETEHGVYQPVLATLENVYGLSNNRNIFLVFAQEAQQKDLMKAKKLDVVFDDGIFNSGISHFTFNKEQIESLPELNFGNTNTYDKE